MVSKEAALYLLIGEDSFSKGAALNELKRKFLGKDIEQFNLDITYAKDTSLFDLQEKILSIPVKSQKRIIIIKDASSLKEDIKAFISKYATKPHPRVVLILDFVHSDPKDKFVNAISRFASVSRFKEEPQLDTFALSRQIELKKTDYALRILNQLLDKGEKAERIMGGLRYSWERSSANQVESKRRMKALLACDIDIKTGKLKDSFALERLIVRLCGL